MKFQPRRFVVEVKRGTSRAAFTSPDTLSQKFSSAEELLFGSAAEPVPDQPIPVKARSAKPNGRILESLIEPPPEVIEELPERPRRGRKPGSKNKPKVLPPQAIAIPSAVAVPPGPRAVEATPVRRRVFDVEALDWQGQTAPSQNASRAPEPDTTAARGEVGETSAGAGRTRLRDRSGIIKRYVLGTEPRPGQPGYLRALREARAR